MPGTEPMNLLILFSDQHSREKTGCYGDTHIHTPNLDRLAAGGARFDSAYCNNPICVPSRSAMAVGDYGFRHSYWDNAHPYAGKEDSWGHRLVRQGRRVVTVGKLHYQGAEADTGFPDQRIPLHVKGGMGDISQTIHDGSIRRPLLRDEIVNAGEGDSDYLRYDANVARLAAEFLRNEGRGDGKPWCLFVGFVCPHFPLRVPRDIMDLYRPYDKLPFPKQWSREERPMHPVLENLRELYCLNDPVITDEVVRRAVAAYYGMTTYMDRQVGVVLEALRESGLEGNTRVVYTDDHGDSVGDHGLFFKHNMYEGSVGVPLIMSGPDIPKGTVITQGASLVDLFPTVLECVGVEPEAEDAALPGVSLLKMARGEYIEDRPVFAEYHALGYPRGAFMLRHGAYKLVHYPGYDPQLFNLREDPDELRDLAFDPACAGVMEDLRRKLRAVCDPDAVADRAKREQRELLERHGGKEAVLKRKGIPFSPVPEGSI